MKNLSIKIIKNIVFISMIIFCQLVKAEHITIKTANNYPYKNLINRTNVVNVFYINTDDKKKCRVEVVLDQMKWTSVSKEVNQNVVNHELLATCLSKEAAEQILVQTYLQFGRGL